MRKETGITLAKVGGSMLSLGLSVFSAVADAKGLAPSVPWKWLTPAAIVAFAIFVYWGWASASLRLRRLEDTHPTVKVEPRREHTWAGLRVTNMGSNAAIFRLKVTKIEAEGLVSTQGQDFDHVFPVKAKWKESSHAKEMHINAKDDADIEVIKTDGLVTDKESQFENLLVYSAIQTYAARIPMDKDIRLAIEVFAEPELKEAYLKTFVLHFNQEGYWDRFEEVK